MHEEKRRFLGATLTRECLIKWLTLTTALQELRTELLQGTPPNWEHARCVFE